MGCESDERASPGERLDGAIGIVLRFASMSADDVAVETEAAPAFALTVVEGPDTGASFTITNAHPSRVLIGTSPACGIRLRDRKVARRHAALDIEGTRFRIVDLGAPDAGLLVHGVAVIDLFLAGGEIVRLGGTAIHVEIVPRAGEAITTATRFGKIVGASPEMRRLYPLCERLAASSAPVILEGEGGTGKEALAESLHEMGPRASGPFIVFDASSIAPSLVEAALFGQEGRRGVFEEADGGTLLLDEIGDLDLATQAKILTILERGEVVRLGSSRAIHVDVRVVATSRRDLDHEIQRGRFREDLFALLAASRVELPPLRRRTGDVVVLARHFWNCLTAREDGASRASIPFPPELLDRVAACSFPGNVRDLYDAVTRRVALGELVEIETARTMPPPGVDFGDMPLPAFPQPPGLPGVVSIAPPSGHGTDFIEGVLALDLPLVRARERVMEELERRYVQRVLAKHDGDVARAAAASGIARRYFQAGRARHSE